MVRRGGGAGAWRAGMGRWRHGPTDAARSHGMGATEPPSCCPCLEPARDRSVPVSPQPCIALTSCKPAADPPACPAGTLAAWPYCHRTSAKGVWKDRAIKNKIKRNVCV